MSVNGKPKALHLADMILRYNEGVCSQAIVEAYCDAADEMRRLYALNQELMAALSQIIRCADDVGVVTVGALNAARAAIANGKEGGAA